MLGAYCHWFTANTHIRIDDIAIKTGKFYWPSDYHAFVLLKKKHCWLYQTDPTIFVGKCIIHSSPTSLNCISWLSRTGISYDEAVLLTAYLLFLTWVSLNVFIYLVGRMPCVLVRFVSVCLSVHKLTAGGISSFLLTSQIGQYAIVSFSWSEMVCFCSSLLDTFLYRSSIMQTLRISTACLLSIICVHTTASFSSIHI